MTQRAAIDLGVHLTVLATGPDEPAVSAGALHRLGAGIEIEGARKHRVGLGYLHSQTKASAFAMVDEVDDNFEPLGFYAGGKLTRIVGEVVNTTKIDHGVVPSGMQCREQRGIGFASWMHYELPVRTSEQRIEKCFGCDLSWGVSLATLGVDVGHVQP